MAVEYYFGHSHMPLWQFVGLLVMFSILIGSPVFVCFVYHRRKERDRLADEVRRAVAHKSRPRYSIDGRDHYMLPFPRDIKRPPSRAGTPRREVSGGSTVPLLVLTPGNSRVSSRNVSPMQGRIYGTAAAGASVSGHFAAGSLNFTPGTTMASQDNYSREAALNANFAERTGTATSLAYPQTAHRAPRPTTNAGVGNYGTLGHVMHTTYTAAQRAYRGRHRLNFWSNWMVVPWAAGRNQPRLEAIDEESVGSSRFSNSRGGNRGATSRNTNGVVPTTATSNVDITRVTTEESDNYRIGLTGSVGTIDTEASGYSMRGTPPAFEKVDSREPYNPNMARSLTRRLLKFGFDQVKDGVAPPERGDADEDGNTGGRQASGVWKKGFELKKRALERKKLETGNRLFSFQKKKSGDNEEEDGDEGDDGGEVTEMDIDPEDLAKTSIRDFAHAFKQDIVGEGLDGVASATGTIRIHQIDDEEDQSILSEETASSMIFEDIDIDSPTDTITNENVPTNTALTTQIEISTPAGTLRGRKALRDGSSVPGTQKMRMTRNTPKNTMGRAALQMQILAEGSREEESGITEVEVNIDGVEILHVEDVSKERSGKSA